MLAEEPEIYDSDPALLDHGPSEDDAPNAALNHHFWDTERWAEQITKQ